MRIYLSFLLCGIFLLHSATTFAQQRENPSRYSLKVKLLDSLDKSPVVYATVALYAPGETTVSKFALSDTKGLAEVIDIAPGNYTLKIELMGYQAIVRSVVFRGRETVMDLGQLLMQDDENMLNEAVVTAVGNPIVVKKDTIQYNASSFKISENDMLEELLKKLPGFEVDADGKITANGKEVTQIRIGDKTFFLDDPSIASKNIPANIVERVNLVNRRSDQARFTGIDDGEEETILDLSIRPGMMNGWFGNLSGGYGTEERYQANAMVGRFSNANQLAFIGNANNTNNRGFADAMGSQMQGMRGGGGMGGGGGVRVGGGNVMNFGGSGITTAWNAGLNGSTEFNNGKLKVGGSYFYGGSERVQESKRERQNFLPDSTFFYNQSGISSTHTESHTVGLEMEYNIDERNSIIFRPRASLGTGSFNESSEYASIGSSGFMINDGKSLSFGSSESRSTSGELSLRHRFEKAGRTISLRLNYNLSENTIDGTNQSETNVYATGNQATDRQDIIDQIYGQTNTSYSLSGRLSYTEPLGGNYYMEAAYRYQFNQNNTDKETYSMNGASGKYDILDPEYSNIFKNNFVNQQFELNVRSNQEKYSYTVGLSLQPSYTHSIGKDSDLSRRVTNFSPRADFRYNFSDNSNLRVEYSGRVNQPSLSQLQPVPDNSNPLYISIGNPDLDPEFAQRLNIEFRDTKMATFRTISARVNVNYTTNRIISKSWYDENGVQNSQPVNEGNAISANGSFMYNTPIARSKFYIMSNTGINYSEGDSYSNAVKNHTTNLGINESLRFSYRGTKLEVGVDGAARFSTAWYTLEQSQNRNTWNNRVAANMNWTLPAGINLLSDISRNFYIGYADGYNTPTTVWNASVTKLVFAGKATVAVRVYDILKEARSVNRNISDNYLEDTWSNVLGQYFMFSFTYRFGTFGGQRGGGMRGPGGGGPMMRPGGAPRF
jgi:hypothetical protein